MKQTGNFAVYPSLRNRVVLVSGGASGIGESIVEAFALQHARVAFLDIQDAAAEALIKRIQSSGFPAPAYFHCDLTDPRNIPVTMQTIVERFDHVDVLVNNAGNDSRHKIEDITPEFWDQIMAVNLRHQFFLIQSVIPAMKTNTRGSIINMSSPSPG
jgi:NAD(P)-dependent dehydrogenase (short-subunit alcohol dehydrogenase family)